MQAAMKITTVVGPGGKIEIISPELHSGEVVEVIILGSEQSAAKRRSAKEIIADAPGQRLFKTAEEVDVYIREERNSWDR